MHVSACIQCAKEDRKDEKGFCCQACEGLRKKFVSFTDDGVSVDV